MDSVSRAGVFQPLNTLQEVPGCMDSVPRAGVFQPLNTLQEVPGCMDSVPRAGVPDLFQSTLHAEIESARALFWVAEMLSQLLVVSTSAGGDTRDPVWAAVVKIGWVQQLGVDLDRFSFRASQTSSMQLQRWQEKRDGFRREIAKLTEEVQALCGVGGFGGQPGHPDQEQAGTPEDLDSTSSDSDVLHPASIPLVFRSHLDDWENHLSAVTWLMQNLLMQNVDLESLPLDLQSFFLPRSSNLGNQSTFEDHQALFIVAKRRAAGLGRSGEVTETDPIFHDFRAATDGNINQLRQVRMRLEGEVADREVARSQLVRRS